MGPKPVVELVEDVGGDIDDHVQHEDEENVPRHTRLSLGQEEDCDDHIDDDDGYTERKFQPIGRVFVFTFSERNIF